MKSVILRFLRLLAGLTIMSVGISMAYQSNLGLSPWDVLNDGASKVLPITFGQASIVLGLVILAIDLAFKEKAGFGTFINILLVGTIVDIVVGLELIPGFLGCTGMEHIIPRVALCVGSLIPSAFGMYFYMSAELGSGPRDSLMCLLTKRSHSLPVGAIRMMAEGVALVIGWLLGGRVGVGTIVLVLLSGPVMQLIFKLCKFDVRRLNNQTISETIKQATADFKKPIA